LADEHLQMHTGILHHELCGHGTTVFPESLEEVAPSLVGFDNRDEL
jgi:hypothetical protein